VRASFFAQSSVPCKIDEYCGTDLPSVTAGIVTRDKNKFQPRSWKFVKHHPSSDIGDQADDEEDTSDEDRKVVLRKQRADRERVNGGVTTAEGEGLVPE